TAEKLWPSSSSGFSPTLLLRRSRWAFAVSWWRAARPRARSPARSVRPPLRSGRRSRRAFQPFCATASRGLLSPSNPAISARRIFSKGPWPCWEVNRYDAGRKSPAGRYLPLGRLAVQPRLYRGFVGKSLGEASRRLSGDADQFVPWLPRAFPPDEARYGRPAGFGRSSYQGGAAPHGLLRGTP